jgi:hypothetical protein
MTLSYPELSEEPARQMHRQECLCHTRRVAQTLLSVPYPLGIIGAPSESDKAAPVLR